MTEGENLGEQVVRLAKKKSDEIFDYDINATHIAFSNDENTIHRLVRLNREKKSALIANSKK